MLCHSRIKKRTNLRITNITHFNFFISFKNAKKHKHKLEMTNVIMEQVAMYMASLPCPPLPLIVNHDEDDSKRKYCNSHDFIASLLLTAMANGNNNLNEGRKKKQIELTETLLTKLGSLEVPIDVDKAYTHFSEFTAGYICAFANIDVGVTFLPLADVEMGDSVHKACCSWNRAQSIILRETEKDERQKKYRELLLVHCERFQKTNDNDVIVNDNNKRQ